MLPGTRIMRRWRNLAVNLGLALASVLVFLGFCELVVFRLVWPASDVPANAFVDGVVRYAPNQHGIWRVRDDLGAQAIISQGLLRQAAIKNSLLPRQPPVRSLRR